MTQSKFSISGAPAARRRRVGGAGSPLSDETAHAGAGLLRLLTWLTPTAEEDLARAYGLDLRLAEGEIREAGRLADWIGALIEGGSAWSDAVLFQAAWRAASAEDADRLDEIAELAESLETCPERRAESRRQGTALLKAMSAWRPAPIAEALYPVALGATAGAAGVPLTPALAGWLHGLATALVASAQGRGLLTAAQGVALLAGLEPLILRTAARGAAASLTDLVRRAARAEKA